MAEWLTTAQNPATVKSLSSEPTGWRLHYVQEGEFVYEKMDGTKIDKSPAACGLTPRHGWDADMFIEQKCKRCLRTLSNGENDQ